MGSANNFRFSLKRINGLDEFVLDKPEHTYTCGRAKDNQIVCLGLTVSRHHCMFFHGKGELYVTDLKSSNGLFINGVAQAPYHTIKLQPNDIIGIGCPDVNVTDNTMFAYKLRAVMTLEPLENNHNSAAVLEPINFENTAISKSETLIKRKREDKNLDIKTLPNKIPRLQTENCFLDKNSFEDKCKINDENDVEIIHISLNNDRLDENNTHHSLISNTESNNTQSTKQSKSSSCCKMENSIQGKKNSSAMCKDQEQLNKSVQNCCIRIVPITLSESIKKTNNGDVNINLENIKSNVKPNKQSNVNKSETLSKTNSTNTFMTEDNECMSSTVLPPNFVTNENAMIKLEDELQLTDTDEEVYKSLYKNVPDVSPIKLKKVQQELKTQFSEVDVVNLSDSEDDVFPCSQLFDIKFGMDNSVKDEVKEEPTEIENERLNMLDETELILLSDSEDEDNNWLHKLSKSQLLTEEDEIDVNRKDLGIEIGDTNVETVDASNDIVRNTVSEPRKEFKECIAGRNDTSLQDASNIVERMDIDVEDHDRELVESLSTTDSSNKIFAESLSDQSLYLKQKETENLTYTLKSSKEKKVPEIEPPHLVTNRRRSRSRTIKEIRDKSIKQKLTGKEKKEQQDRVKLEEYLRMKENKNRKIIHKWADCLPSNKKERSFLTKEEKKDLADRRKIKLQKIAMEKKRACLEDNQDKKRVVSKPIAKVTKKTRNDFLVEETISASKSDDLIEKPKASSSRSTSISSKSVESAKGTNVPKDIAALLQRSLTLSDISIGRIPKKKTVSKAKSIDPAQSPQKKDSSESKVNKVTGNNKKGTKFGKKLSIESDQKEFAPIHKSCIRTNETIGRTKRVSFSRNLKTVREYQIDDSNTLNKLVGKDAPIPSEKVPLKKPVNVMEFNAKLNEFLARIFSWNPIWLEEQQYLNTSAPVVRIDEIHPMLTHYKSYDDYYNIMSPLLLLETWNLITKDFLNIEQSFRRPTLMSSIVENSIQRNTVSSNTMLTTLMLEVLVTKEDIRKQTLPIFGDLVFFEYVKNQERGQTFHKVFAYVINVHETILTPSTRYNKDLLNYVKNPHSLITYTMKTKLLDNNIPVNRIQRLRTVTYLRPSLRMVQALQYLPSSPLVNLILDPKIEMYQLPIVSNSEVLITDDKLNEKQLEAVQKVTKAVVQKDAKLCFIQGPPGTGKSKVIVNIVTQVLYGNDRYVTNKSSLKILVCAPSNAAIDEIVLRLLDIRSNIKRKTKMKPFKMVRMGRLETMHATVKDISVTELARRDIEKQISSSNSITPDSVENEKLHLESKMNALKSQLTTSRNMDETHRQYIKMRLGDMAAKYDLLKNCRTMNNRNEKEYMRLLRAAENRILEHADIITCTLSSCYTNQMESIFGGNKRKISVCIVDEATQSCEAETLIPLMLGINVLVLVGDPNQLPATVLSPQAKKYGLDQSLFLRVQNAFDMQPNNPIITLDTQYRMQHSISCWPNKFFYGGILKNAVKQRQKFPFYPYRILNLNTNQNDDNFSNNAEAEFIANMIYAMLTGSNLDNWESCISYGILTPYNNQKSVIEGKISEKISPLPENVKKKMKFDINTVDGFQGQERDVIIMSCVRSQKIGFLSDRQRLCVALTRAKHSLIICGNFNIFMKDAMWKSLLSDAKSRKVYFDVNADAGPDKIKPYIIK